MKTAKLLAVAVATLASLPLMAQQVNAAAQQSASGSAAGMSANESAHANAHANANANQRHGKAGSANAGARGSAASYAQMRPVSGRLLRTLNTKSARVGQTVILKTTRKTRTASGTVIPKGSRLIGRVTEVHAHSRGHEASSMAIAFNRVLLKNGQSFAIRSMIESVAPSATALAANSMMQDQNSFAGPPAGAPMGGGPMGGGMAGGAGGGLMGGGGPIAGGGPVAGVVGGAASAAGSGAVSAMGSGAASAAGSMGRMGAGVNSAAEGAMNATGNAMNATGNLAGRAAGALRNGVGASANAVSALGAHATAIPGVMLDSHAAGGASGMFTAARKNIRLDSGTQMVVGVVAAAH